MGVRAADRLHRSFPAFLYALGCREPLPGLHERYVAARWRQTLGSTMHCVAGDGVGILAGAVLAGILGLTGAAEVILEYVLGFAFGWMTFQTFFVREMTGGLLFPLTYQRLHSGAALDEPVYGRNGADGDGVAEGHCLRGRSHDRRLLVRKSIGVMVGFMIPHPMNWWVVANHLKHGMTTVRPAGMPAQRRIRMQRPACATRRTSASSSHGARVGTATTSASHGFAVVCRPGRWLGNRLFARAG
jgi:hypothetical protein